MTSSLKLYTSHNIPFATYTKHKRTPPVRLWAGAHLQFGLSPVSIISKHSWGILGASFTVPNSKSAPNYPSSPQVKNFTFQQGSRFPIFNKKKTPPKAGGIKNGRRVGDQSSAGATTAQQLPIALTSGKPGDRPEGRNSFGTP